MKTSMIIIMLGVPGGDMVGSGSKTVLVTGASSGIGKAKAEYLAEAGYRVFSGVRRLETASYSAGVEGVQLDVTGARSVKTAVAP
jgi:NADP-dependent 3-hydroxy acid dehydrogenase YdfG